MRFVIICLLNKSFVIYVVRMKRINVLMQEGLLWRGLYNGANS